MNIELKDKIVLISGGTGGLGTHVTRAFLDANAIVYVTYTKEEYFESLKQQIQSGSDRLFGVKNNILDDKDVQQMVMDVVGKTGGIDILINLVGGFLADTSITNTSDDQWDKMLALNLKSAVNACRNVLPTMMKRKSGRIINVGARPGLTGAGGMAAYAASKAALINFTQSLSRESRSENITANVIIPDTIDSPANRKAMPRANFSEWISGDSLAGITLFLGSDQAQDINGAIIPVFGRL
jgi:NAD(P)-dependent dehydrogenase (short-subunit alcohol dehydrogenase family)